MLHEGILKDIASNSTKSNDLKDSLNKNDNKGVAKSQVNRENKNTR